MLKVIGLICIVVGVMLLVWGHKMSESIGSQLQATFVGGPTEPVMHRYIGGVVLLIAGIALLFWPMKRR
ncbi:MAG: DUF3185 family protein [Limisphaerales bacterium]